MERKLENIRVWQDARAMVKQIYELMANVHDNGFKDQIQRAAVSIMNNIAEGSEAGSDTLFQRYLNIAKASCSEVKSMLFLCEDLGFCATNQREEIQKQLLSITSQIYRLIESLDKKAVDR